MKRIKVAVIMTAIVASLITGLTVTAASYWLPRAVKALAAREGVPAWVLWDACYPSWDTYWNYYTGNRR